MRLRLVELLAPVLGDPLAAYLVPRGTTLLLAAVCAGAPGAPPPVDCFDGFPAQLKLVMRAGETEITAIRRLRLRFALSVVD